MGDGADNEKVEEGWMDESVRAHLERLLPLWVRRRAEAVEDGRNPDDECAVPVRRCGRQKMLGREDEESLVVIVRKTMRVCDFTVDEVAAVVGQPPWVVEGWLCGALRIERPESVVASLRLCLHEWLAGAS